MRIDAKGTIGQYPALLVRTTLRHLRSRLSWGLAELDAAAGLKPGDGRALVKTLRSEGLIEAAGRGFWRRPVESIGWCCWRLRREDALRRAARLQMPAVTRMVARTKTA